MILIITAVGFLVAAILLWPGSLHALAGVPRMLGRIDSFIVSLPAPVRRRLYESAIAVGVAISAKVGVDAHTFMQWVQFALIAASTVGVPTLARRKTTDS